MKYTSEEAVSNVHRKNSESPTRAEPRWLRRPKYCGYLLSVCVAACFFANTADADQIRFGGVITQSTEDGTGPAVNNPALNNILSGDLYRVTLDFAGAITSAGTYPLSGVSMAFLDLSALISETS